MGFQEDQGNWDWKWRWGPLRGSHAEVMVPPSTPLVPIPSAWCPQIGQWHVTDGLSMDSHLDASNISASLFNTTLVVTTILVSGVWLCSPAAVPRVLPQLWKSA